MAHETVIRSSLLVRDVQNPNTATQKFAVFTGSGNNDLNLLGFRTPTELLSDIGFNEAVDDRVSTLIQAGANISVTYDDDGNALIIAAPNTVTGSGTATQIAFWKSGSTTELTSSSNLYWDNVNGRLGVGTSTPSGTVSIQGIGTGSTTQALVIANSTQTALLTVLNNGRIQQTIPNASNNTLFGTGAGNNTTGAGNSFFGMNAGIVTTSGINNSFFGINAGNNNTTGQFNVFLGEQAGVGNTTGSQNTFAGFRIALSLQTGLSNTFIGGTSALNLTSGNYNTFIGADSGRRISGGDNLTVANNSVFLGFDTRALASGQTNQTVIGYNAIGLGSNTTVIGNTGTTQTHLHGNLTLGSTNTPNARMVVTGADTTDTGWTAQFHNSLGNNNSLMIRNDGNVGIGTSGTTARLVVRGSGNTSTTDALKIENSDGIQLLKLQNQFLSGSNTGLQIGDGTNANTTFIDLVRGAPTLRTRYIDVRTSADILYINGGVGVGNNNLANNTGSLTLGDGLYNLISPTQFNVAVSVTGTFAPTSGGASFVDLLVRPTINQTGGATGTTRGLFINPTLTSAPNWRSIEWTNDSGFGLYGAGSGTNYLNGNLGIKTTTPAQTLHVAGTMRLTGNAGTATEALGRDANGDLSGVPFSTIVASGGGVSGSGTATQVAFWGGTTGSTSTALSGSSNLYWDNVNGRLGLGTTTPSGKLNTISTSDVNALHQRISNDITSPGIIFRKARGTIASPTVVQQGDLLGSFGFSGLLSDGTTYSNDNSFFGGQVSGPVTSTNLPTSIFFKVGQTATPYLVSFYIHDSGRSRFSSEAISSALPQPRAKLEVIGQTNANTGWTAQFHNNLGNSNSLVIRDDGNVGIGTSGTTARFIVRASGSSSGSTAMLVENSGGTSMLMVREDGRVSFGTANPSKPFHVSGEAYFASALQLEGGLKDNRDNVFLSQSLNSVTSNRDIILGNGTYARIRLHSKEVSIGASFPTTNYLFYVDGGTGTGITDRQGIYIRPTQPAAGGNTNGGDVIIELPNGTGTGRKGAVLIGASATTIDSALLELVSTDRGFLPPRMTTTQRDAIATPATGLQIYNTTLNVMQHYNGTTWVSEAGGSGGTGTVSGSGTATQVAFWGGTTGSTSTALSGSSNLYWDGVNGRLGVGTSTPSAPLTIKSYGNSISTNEAFSIFNSAATPLNLLTVLENGNIGIGGQTSPIYKLDILGNLRLGTSSIQFGIGESGGNSVILGSLTNHPYRFIVNTNEAARFTTDRNLSIGATGSTARLLVVGSQPSGTTTWTAQFHNALGNSNSLMIRDDGNVGIGTSTPNFKLTVQANDAGLLVSGANVSPFTQIIASFVYGGNGNTINVENRGGRASFQARATTAVGAAASPLFLNPNGGTVSVNNDNPDASAIFDVRSTTQGFLPPRMSTANRNLISSPATGLQVYNSSLNVMQHYNGVSWVNEANPILTRVSTGTTQVELFLDGVSSRFGLVGTNKVWNFRIQLCAIVASAGTGTLDIADSYISEHLIGIKRSGSSINVVGGGVVQNLIGANTQMEDSVVTITGDSGTESLRVFYTPPSGAAANTVIRISATLYYTEAGV